jgi:hypothetical protein
LRKTAIAKTSYRSPLVDSRKPLSGRSKPLRRILLVARFQFSAQDSHVRRRFNPKPDSISIHTNHRQYDRVAKLNALAFPPRQNQHA